MTENHEKNLVLKYTEVSEILLAQKLILERDRLGSNSMGEKDLDTHTCNLISKSMRIFRLGVAFWGQSRRMLRDNNITRRSRTCTGWHFCNGNILVTMLDVFGQDTRVLPQRKVVDGPKSPLADA